MTRRIKLALLFISLHLCIDSIAQSFYDEGSIQTIRITFAQSNWDALLDAEKSGNENYIMATSVSINGTVYDSVGVKYKGNSTYNANQVKNPFHIELDTYKDHEHDGYTDIKLSNVYNDPSFVREVLSYQVLRNYMDAPLSNYANVYVNNSLIGLYSNSESISKKFVKNRFGSNNNTFVKCNPPAGAGPGTNDYPNLVYLGTDSSNYYAKYELKSDHGWDELIHLCDTLANHTAEIEKILDVDRALWMLAFNVVLVNLDSYSGGFTQNYYLYRGDDGRFLPIVWDLNESFGSFTMTGSGTLNGTAAAQQMSHLLHSTDATFPLISKLLAVPSYKKMYLAHVKTMLQDHFTNNGPYYTEGQSLQTTVNSSVQADPNKFYTYANFTSNLTTDISSGGGPRARTKPGITNLMNGRYNYLMGQSDFTAIEPIISAVSLSDSTPNVGDTLSFTANVTNETGVYLRYRTVEGAVFEKVAMLDDGLHNDGAANDNVYGIEVQILGGNMEYYIYAENNTIGKFSPTNAEHEFYSVGAIPESIGDLVINEFMASNDVTVADQDGEYDDWIEIYNLGSTAINLENYRLSDDETDFSLFSFPAGTIINPNEYITVWADGDTSQAGFHTNFKISSGGETLYLTDSSLLIIDSISFEAQVTDTSFGRFPNGSGSFQMMPPTFGLQNSLTITPPTPVASDIVINEFLASNSTTNTDQDGEFEDWIEIYNKGNTTISLENYRLSDDQTDLTLFTFPAGTTINPNEYITVWADGDLNQVGLHADFKLSSGGETIYLTDSSLAIIDSVNFGAQVADTSYGRFPNGTGSFQKMPPTFDAQNSLTVTPPAPVVNSIVINEFLASNSNINADQDGEYDDWIEIYNKGNTTVSLGNYRLSDDETDLSLFTFPAGTTINPNEYITVWADGDLNQAGYHADFKISSGGETLYLADSTLAIIDSVNFGTQVTDSSFGRLPNGTGSFQVMPPTFGAENSLLGSVRNIVLNEFLASNTTTSSDQNGEFDDWIEIFNKGNVAMNLEGVKLSDTKGDYSLFSFPAGTVIEPDSFIVVWADQDLSQPGNHANFELSLSGGVIYLVDSSLNILDSVTYNTQTADVSYGRYPNGTGSFQTMIPTFRSLNIINPTSIGDLVINEFLASNTAIIADQDGEFDDWVELYNKGTINIDLEYYSLSDDRTNLSAYTFPVGTVLAPDSFIVVWADGDTSQLGYHADFKLSSGGETIYLSDSSSTIVDSILFSNQTTDKSFGRYPNGTGAFISMTPTFGALNINITGINGVSKLQENLFLYPNPNNGSFSLKFEGQQQGEVNIEIRSMNGKLIEKRTIHPTQQSDQLEFDISNQAQGVYLIRISNQTAVGVLKFTKM